MTAQSKLRAAPIFVVLALLIAGGASSPAHIEPPFRFNALDQWSFEENPIPSYEEMSEHDRKILERETENLHSMDYCLGDVEVRFALYRDNHPRFDLIADDPRAFQKFLHNGTERTFRDATLCFPALLRDRIFNDGKGRCNFNVEGAVSDPILKADIEKVIALIESRHTYMVNMIIRASILIRSNRLMLDTKLYISQLSPGPEWMQESISRWSAEMKARDPKRHAFILEAARRNDFHAVLRTNPPCLRDRPSD